MWEVSTCPLWRHKIRRNHFIRFHTIPGSVCSGKNPLMMCNKKHVTSEWIKASGVNETDTLPVLKKGVGVMWQHVDGTHVLIRRGICKGDRDHRGSGNGGGRGGGPVLRQGWQCEHAAGNGLRRLNLEHLPRLRQHDGPTCGREETQDIGVFKWHVCGCNQLFHHMVWVECVSAATDTCVCFLAVLFF